MTTFGWKRKTGERLKTVAIALLEPPQEESTDLPFNARNSKVISLEDGAIKSKRLREEGCILAETQRYWEAIKRWDEAIQLSPKDETLLEMKAQALMELHEVYPAVQTASLVVKLNPQWWVAYQTLGRSQLGLGEVKLAVRNFCKAVHLKPDNKELWNEDLKWTWSLLKRQRKSIVENALQSFDFKEMGKASITELEESPSPVTGAVEIFQPMIEITKKPINLKSKKWIKMRSSPY